MFKYITLGISCLIIGHSYCADVHFSPAQEAVFSKLKKQQYELFKNAYEGEERDELIVDEKYIDDVHTIVDQYFTQNGYDVLKKDIFTDLVDCIKHHKNINSMYLEDGISVMMYWYKREKNIAEDLKIRSFAKLAYGGYKIALRDIMTSEQITKYECKPWHFSEQEKDLHHLINERLHDITREEFGNNTDQYEMIKSEHVGMLHCILDVYCEKYCSKKQISSIYKSMVSKIDILNKSDRKYDILRGFFQQAVHRGYGSMNTLHGFNIPMAYAGFLQFARQFMTDEEQEMCECKPKLISFGEMQQLYSTFSGMGTFPQN